MITNDVIYRSWLANGQMLVEELYDMSIIDDVSSTYSKFNSIVERDPMAFFKQVKNLFKDTDWLDNYFLILTA